jgi:L-asparagine transporter-like permease
MSELTAVAKYINYWWPHAAWQSVLFFFVIITAINLTNVKFYGESEFWLAIIKVTAVVAMILFGLFLLFTADANSTAHLVTFGHMVDFSKWFDGLFYMLAFIMFAFGGIELIGMAAAEAMIQRKRFQKRLIKLLCVFWFSMLVH